MSFSKFWKNPHWKESITRDWQAKLASIGVAIVLWWFVYTQTNVERSFYVPIAYVNLPPHFIILKTNDTLARVHIQGKKEKVSAFENSQIRVFVDLSEASLGWNTNEIQLSMVNIDPSLAVTLEKTRTSLLIDSLEVLSLPIVPRFVDTLPTGLEIETIELRPASTLVRGPAFFITNVTFVETYPISLKNITNTITTNVVLLAPQGAVFIAEPTNQITIRVRLAGATDAGKTE